MKKNNKIWLWIFIATIIIAVVLTFLLNKGGYQLVLDTSKAEQGVIENTITATGEIQPVYKVEVGTQVSGIVKKLYVDYNSQVKRGDLLAELDKSLLQQQLKQSEASLSTAKSNCDLAQKNFDRVKSLYDKKAATQEEYDQAESELQSAKNQVITAQSNYSNAATNLSYAIIYSPIDGVVLSKEVEEGQTVAASFSTPTIFTIANDLKQMQVEASVDEADIGQVKVGQPVTFTVDAFPKDVFKGSVKQIRLDPTETNNVITYVVIIDAPNEEEKLYPGMTANVTIIVEHLEGIIIPLEATYTNLMTMKEEMEKKGYSCIDEKGAHDQLPEGKAAIFSINGKSITHHVVTTGMDDGANIIVTEGLKAGEEVILSVNREKVKAKKEGAVDNPLQMGPPERKKR